MKSAPWFTSPLVALGLTASCGVVNSPAGTGPSIPSLITAIEQAPRVTKHWGLRRVEVHHALPDGSTKDLVYREEILQDGEGNFLITPQEVLSQTSLDPWTFLVKQSQRQGYFWRYRDFQIRHLEFFADNYKINNLGNGVIVAGQTCWELDVARPGAGGRYYRVAADVLTGLVLRYQEYDADGSLLSLMEYEQIDFDPDLAGAAWHQPTNQETVIDLDGDLNAQLGFVASVPKLLPQGFQALEVRRVVDHTYRPWLKVTLSDGAESIFFLHAKPEASSGNQMVQGSGSDTGSTQASDSFYHYSDGPYTVVHATIQNQEYLAMGKMPVEYLVAIIESALP